MAIGVFGLKKVYKKQVQNIDEGLSLNIPGLLYGYYAGAGNGNTSPPFFSTIDRLDFSTETVTTPTPKLSTAKGEASGVSNNSYGYFGGGYHPTPSIFSTIERLDFSTETVSVPTFKLSVGRGNLGSTSSGSYGYFGGGGDSFFTVVSTIDRLDFSTETVSVPTPKLSIARRNLKATSSNSYGYFGGGSWPSSPTSLILYSTIDRLDFLTETVSVPTPKLSSEKSSTGTTSSDFYGYFAGGFGPPNAATVDVSTIDRLDFSTETVSVPTQIMFSYSKSL